MELATKKLGTSAQLTALVDIGDSIWTPRRSILGHREAMSADRRFPPPWSVEDPGTGSPFVVKIGSGQNLAYVYYEGEEGRRSAAKMLTKDEARRITG